ncbi:hypothetical protein CHS0354_036996 [Potamilus streckersoni]|uniref:Nck-associated protein 5 n=1 Tax=Potamilus streckersoni TaxID=2493646 RepID=A0AAE0SKD2_9BIVA|nr:hypothetical protein CHS0354_036996 [Potamilus streckersoni]
MSLKFEKTRRPNLGISSTRINSGTLPKQTMGTHQPSAASKELKDVLEKKIEDLSRQLAEEKSMSRREKMQVTRLQRELSRHKTDKNGREILLKDLERERMLRMNAEQRLREMAAESESCHSRLEALQVEFRKMEEAVQGMMQYKTKIDQLKQEKASLTSTYENNLQKHRAHLSDFERENMMLLNEVKKLESQLNSKPDDRDRSKLLLERLKMLEAENSSLVLENEQQRQQYEKCLDEIANQVVQALLAQKTLREECLKLQGRVRDLEMQNRHLSLMFQQRMRGVTSEPALQQPQQMAQRSCQSMGDQHCHEVFLQGSIESIQSMFSEQMSDNFASMPQMSSPPPWLQDHLSFPGNRHSVISLTGSIQSTPEFCNGISETLLSEEFSCRTKIETEFPATNSSPKVKHVSVYERANNRATAKRSSSTSSLMKQPRKLRTSSASSLIRTKSGLSTQSLKAVLPTDIAHLPSNSVVLPYNKTQLPSNSTQSNVELVHNQGPSATGSSNITGSINETQTSKTTMAISQSNSVPSVNQSQGPLQTGSRQLPQDTCVGAQGGNRQSQSKIPVHNSIGNSSIGASVSNEHNQQKRPNSNGKDSAKRSGNTGHCAQRQSHPPAKSPLQSCQQKQNHISNLPQPNMVSHIPVVFHSPLQHQGSQTTKSAKQVTRIPTKSETTGNPSLKQKSKSRESIIQPQMKGKPMTNPHINSPSNTPPQRTMIPPKTNPYARPRTESKGNNSQTKGEYSITGGLTQGHCPSGGTKGQYFYDYSDEDSDFNRPVSRDFSIASTVSLDELLDISLDNVDTPIDTDFSAENCIYLNAEKLKNFAKQSMSKTSPELTLDTSADTKNSHNLKPDIVRDTENSEQRNMTKSLTASQLSSHSVSDYKSKRPKSLILAPQDKSLVFYDYVSSSSTDSSSDEDDDEDDDDWSYQLSYARNLKQKEHMRKKNQSKGNNSKSDSSKNNNLNLQSNTSQVEKLKGDKNVKTMSQIPKLVSAKKSVKSPPPVPQKPTRTSKTSPTDTSIKSSFGNKSELIVTASDFTPVSNVQTVCYQFSSDISHSNVIDIISPKMNTGKSSSLSDIPGVENCKQIECFNFDEVKVERSGSKDDGYSTMSSDVQPEAMEKFSDMSMEHRNEYRHSYDSFNSAKESPSRSRMDNRKNKTYFDVTSDPDSALESSTTSNDIRNSNQSLSSQNSLSGEDKPNNYGSLGKVKAMRAMFELDAMKLHDTSNKSVSPLSPMKLFRKSASFDDSVNVLTNTCQLNNISGVHIEENNFSDLPDFDSSIPCHNRVGLLREGGYDGNSSTSDGGSDMTSLHISEDNILSDIPEEKEDYDSSAEKRSEKNLSATSLVSKKITLKFQTKVIKRYWASMQGLTRAISDSDIGRDKKDVAKDYDEMFSGHLNADEPLERSASVSDLCKQRKKETDIQLSPRLRRSHCRSLIDEINVEGKVQEILKNQLFQQLSSSVVSADGDQKDFNNFVEILRQKGHILDNDHDPRCMNTNTEKSMHQSSSLSSRGGNSTESQSPSEERTYKDNGEDIFEGRPIGEEQKKFKKQFYSLCDVGSNKSICSNEEKRDALSVSSAKEEPVGIANNCKHKEEFDEISKQIATLSKTVHELHRSLSSLNSDNSDWDYESNEGDHSYFLASAIGNKEIDGYHWVEDEFFLSPYEGGIIMGCSPTSLNRDTGDLMNEYLDENAESEDPRMETGDMADNGKMRERLCCDTDLKFAEPEKMNEACQLDTMLNNSLSASQDSLDDNIGVDHVMCHRLLGKDRNDGMKEVPLNSQPDVDISKFYTRYSNLENEAVAAFDYLNKMSTSQTGNSNTHQEVAFKRKNESDAQFKKKPEVAKKPSRAVIEKMKQKHKTIDSDVQNYPPSRPKFKKERTVLNKKSTKQHLHKQSKMSSSSPDSPMDGSGDDISLSDSCCESFSSDLSSTEDTTEI